MSCGKYTFCVRLLVGKEGLKVQRKKDAPKVNYTTASLPGLSPEETFELTPKGEIGEKLEDRKAPPKQTKLFPVEKTGK